MQVKKSNVNRVSTHSAVSKVTRRKSPLEDMNPTEAASMVLLFCKITFVIELILGIMLIVFAFSEGEIGGGVGGLLVLIFAYVGYIIGSRILIAPLMTWHFSKENMNINNKMLSEIVALRCEQFKQNEPPAPTADEVATPTPSPTPPPTPKAPAKPAQQIRLKSVKIQSKSMPSVSIPTTPTMAICPGCGTQYDVTPETRGKKVQCPECETSFIFPL